jgi:hypothetical protein
VPYTATATDAVGVTSFMCVPASGSTFPLGMTTVTCTASDAAGNTSHATFHVTVQDTTPPTISGATNITVTTPNPAGTAVTFNPVATDLVDGPVPVVCAPPSGSTFTIGTTPVNCTATDSHGNTATASFTVTVNLGTGDTTPPVISGLPANKTLEATGPYGVHFTFNITVKDPDDAGTFQCTGGPIMSYAFPVVNGNVYSYTVTAPLGIDTITCNATDSHGNNATPGSFVLTVHDTTPPVITVHNVTALATSLTGANVSYPAPTATDLVSGTVPVTCTPPSGSFFPNGIDTVNCTATDGAGNVAHKSFVVVVLSAGDQMLALKLEVTLAPELLLHSGHAVQQKLLKDLSRAGNVMDPSDKGNACTQLAKFISDVQANTTPHGPITAADSTTWVNGANAIRTAVGC